MTSPGLKPAISAALPGVTRPTSGGVNGWPRVMNSTASTTMAKTNNEKLKEKLIRISKGKSDVGGVAAAVLFLSEQILEQENLLRRIESSLKKAGIPLV